ncbi:hypothetical protein EVA_16786 [gut metagenome]|uniref:Uncharacterized protein n=1 Tax=gut metagenome TaxID=749906 RepID=J9FJN8_9ZZZZ
MSMIRPVKFSSPRISRSRTRCSFGKSGVKFSKSMRCLTLSGGRPFTDSTRTKAK